MHKKDFLKDDKEFRLINPLSSDDIISNLQKKISDKIGDEIVKGIQNNKDGTITVTTVSRVD